MSDFKRPRHRLVAQALDAMNAEALGGAHCFFGGGTRIVLALGEYRESADIDFLCADASGYRTLRSSITHRSLGPILKAPIPLAREVIADRYGIRTFLDLGEMKLKLEIVLEARIALDGAECSGTGQQFLSVPLLDRASCFAEKFLANADRHGDSAFLARDAIDLAFMIEGWDEAQALAGYARAVGAYGRAIDRALKPAVQRLLDDKAHFRYCVEGLGIADTKTLTKGLRALSSGAGWKGGQKAPAARPRSKS